MRDVKNLTINLSSLFGIALVFTLILTNRILIGDVGGLMMDYHLDHSRIDKEIRRGATEADTIAERQRESARIQQEWIRDFDYSSTNSESRGTYSPPD